MDWVKPHHLLQQKNVNISHLGPLNLEQSFRRVSNRGLEGEEARRMTLLQSVATVCCHMGVGAVVDFGYALMVDNGNVV